MKRIIFFILIIMLGMGCSHSNSEMNQDLFQYKNSYVGDNSAIGNIITRLPSPNGEYYTGFELKTTEKPYGIIIHYQKDTKTEPLENDYEKTVCYNATVIFALVQNADFVQFNFSDKTYEITKKELENWYNVDIEAIMNEKELEKAIQELMTKEGQLHLLFND